MDESTRPACVEVLPPEPDPAAPPTSAAQGTGGHRRHHHSHHGRRHASHRRRRIVLGVVAAVLWAAAFAIGLFQGARAPVSLAVPPLPQATAVSPVRVPARPVVRPVPTVFPYSVVVGGVRSADEARAAIARDVVVAAHYAGFDVTGARLVRVDRPRRAHVSYRIGNRVYWTKRPVALRVGEPVLTDGAHEIRARCGNRIADEVLGETSELEPDEVVFDEPILVAEDEAEPPPLPNTFQAVPPMPLIPPVPARYPPQAAPRYPPQVTPRSHRIPEPGVIALFALGAGVLAARRLRARRH